MGFRGRRSGTGCSCLVPLLLGIFAAGLTAWFNAQQDARQNEIEEQRAQDAALQAYLDQMSMILLGPVVI